MSKRTKICQDARENLAEIKKDTVMFDALARQLDAEGFIELHKKVSGDLGNLKMMVLVMIMGSRRKIPKK
ncbi:hypothetical protein HON36_04500 [Candidatus Parcubacteria bacterium]|jgi:hypothetical protein|nr:hypothetical protein [Candidatus Parcubacteria bacterium]MBT7227979.1 hypothetical protein [Candidatus Parcubacteria bacterium]